MPWGISHKYKFIFIHIPKTAGTTICSSWEGSLLKEVCKETGVLGGTHKSALQLREAFPEEWGSYLKWSVVRNPYDRFVSKFFYKALAPRTDWGHPWVDKECEGLLPQLYWLTDREQIHPDTGPYFRADIHTGNVLVDRVLRFENLETELRALFDELGMDDINSRVFPHFRATAQWEDGKTWRDFFSPELKSLVSFMYREDLARLGYEW